MFEAHVRFTFIIIYVFRIPNFICYSTTTTTISPSIFFQVLHLLRRYLGEYVHGLSSEALRISVWKGSLSIYLSIIFTQTQLWSSCSEFKHFVFWFHISLIIFKDKGVRNNICCVIYHFLNACTTIY